MYFPSASTATVASPVLFAQFFIICSNLFMSQKS